MTDPVAAGFRGAGARMAQSDLADEAQAHGYELAVLEAVLDVESSGAGFDQRGRPKILTEPHIFYRQLASQPAKQFAATLKGLAYEHQGERPYPPTSDENYERLVAMCAIDETAALQSASWGIAQVMGLNHAVCGFATVQDMVLAAMAGERQQFGFLVRYAEHTGLSTALKTKDWAAFARGYNGPGAVAVYASKLAQAYARHVSSIVAKPGPTVGASSLRHAPIDFNALNEAEWLRVRGGFSS